MAKVMTAKWAGTCCYCRMAFEAGSRIAYTGNTYHADCFDAETADIARKDAEDLARQAAWTKRFKAGELATVRMTDREVIVDRVPTYAMAVAEARAFVASVSAATGVRTTLRKHRARGKWFLGRELVSYYGGSSLGHHEGWSFSYSAKGGA